jgi:hypothetical protein
MAGLGARFPRTLLVATIAFLLAVQVVRNAAVTALSELRPQSAARLWMGHPSVETSQALADIARASRARRAIEPGTFEMIDDAAMKSPLSPEPYLVRGVQAQVGGDPNGSKDAFLAAQWRDPRSMPAAYFLTNYYSRSGDALRALEQMSLLARLSPGGTATVTPFVAAYARDSSNWPKLRALFQSQPALEDGVLSALAQNPSNSEAILALADSQHRRPSSEWLPILLGSLVAGGDYARARAIWSSVGRGNASSGLVFDPGFSTPIPPPPFNWSLASSSFGLAERQPGGRLHVIFYGHVDGVLASQLLLLAPGNYRMQLRLGALPEHPEGLQWSIRCDRSTELAASATLDDVASSGWAFEVPANCPAQWLELSGRSGDVAQQSDVTISGLSVTRAAPHA